MLRARRPIICQACKLAIREAIEKDAIKERAAKERGEAVMEMDDEDPVPEVRAVTSNLTSRLDHA